jgi:indole-3-glycerol phosphate synthase
MTILDRINDHKLLEIARRKEQTPVERLIDSYGYRFERRSLVESIRDSKSYGIITEFKRKSPSQDNINIDADPALVSKGYQDAGAAGISCLTDVHFFGARSNDIDIVRKTVKLPVIRKDFILDAYQLHEARAMGADAVLLIAASLTAGHLDDLAAEANELGLEVLCEVHNNLKDFTVNIENSLRLAEMLPPSLLKISESAIEDPETIVKLRHEGFDGFLIGTFFMRQEDPGKACAEFIARVREIEGLYNNAIA